MKIYNLFGFVCVSISIIAFHCDNFIYSMGLAIMGTLNFNTQAILDKIKEKS